MNKRQFIQQATIEMIAHPDILEKQRAERFDHAIRCAEELWQKLCEYGYGATKESEPKDTRDWYKELSSDRRLHFDKCWKLYKRVGARNEAAKAWHKIDKDVYDHIRYAIPKYYEQCGESGTSICHFSTWLNQCRWQSFELKIEKTHHQSGVHNERSAEIKHLKSQIDFWKSKGKISMASDLEKQLEKVNGAAYS